VKKRRMKKLLKKEVKCNVAKFILYIKNIIHIIMIINMIL